MCQEAQSPTPFEGQSFPIGTEGDLGVDVIESLSFHGQLFPVFEGYQVVA